MLNSLRNPDFTWQSTYLTLKPIPWCCPTTTPPSSFYGPYWRQPIFTSSSITPTRIFLSPWNQHHKQGSAEPQTNHFQGLSLRSSTEAYPPYLTGGDEEFTLKMHVRRYSGSRALRSRPRASYIVLSQFFGPCRAGELWDKE